MARRKATETTEGAEAPKAKHQGLPRGVKVYKKGEPIPPIIWRVKTIPEQRLRDKLARDMVLEISRSKLDVENKKFIFYVVKNIDAVPLEVTFKEAAARYGWKSFKLEMNNTVIVPEWMDHGADE